MICAFFSAVIMHSLLSIDSDQLFLMQSKAIKLQAWAGPEGSRRLRLPDFKTNKT